jgi:transcriptional regulator with XRE-family HTH domain
MSMKPDIEKQLRKAIEEADITRYRLSMLSGVSQAILSLFMNGKRTITLETAAKLAVILGLELKPTSKTQKKAR